MEIHVIRLEQTCIFFNALNFINSNECVMFIHPKCWNIGDDVICLSSGAHRRFQIQLVWMNYIFENLQRLFIS